MATMADIMKKADTVSTFIDDSTPAGHFVAATTVVGIATFYLLKGERDDMAAPVVGRLESPVNKSSNAYKGDGLKGGTFIASNVSFLDAMNRIAS